MHTGITTTRLISIVLLLGLCACSTAKSERHSGKKHDKKEKAEKLEEQSVDMAGGQAGTGAGVSRFASTDCDDSLWNHVYDPTRLRKLAACVTVTGIVEESNADKDGDQHFLIKLDPGQDALVNKTNRKKKNGDLVVEIVCANPVTLRKAKAACKGYTNRVSVPPVGAHVKATGTYVIDSHNGWAEIHPVSKLQRL